MLGEGEVGSQPGRPGRDYVQEEPKRQLAVAGGVSRRAGGGGVSHNTGGGGVGRGARGGSGPTLVVSFFMSFSS
jgi:hypothetical protein